MIKGLEKLLYEERLRDMALLSQEKRKLRGIFSVHYKCLLGEKGGEKKRDTGFPLVSK